MRVFHFSVDLSKLLKKLGNITDPVFGPILTTTLTLTLDAEDGWGLRWADFVLRADHVVSIVRTARVVDGQAVHVLINLKTPRQLLPHLCTPLDEPYSYCVQYLEDMSAYDFKRRPYTSQNIKALQKN